MLGVAYYVMFGLVLMRLMCSLMVLLDCVMLYYNCVIVRMVIQLL